MIECPRYHQYLNCDAIRAIVRAGDVAVVAAAASAAIPVVHLLFLCKPNIIYRSLPWPDTKVSANHKVWFSIRGTCGNRAVRFNFVSKLKMSRSDGQANIEGI